MTKEQAEKLVREALAALRISLKEHQALQEAVTILVKQG